MEDLSKYDEDFFLFLEGGFVAINQADENSAVKLFKACGQLRPENPMIKVGMGYLADRLGKLRVVVAIGLSAGPVIFLINLIPYGFGFAVLLLLIGALMFMRMPASEAHIVNTIPLRLRSRVLGIYFFAGIEGSAILMPIVGFLIDRRGFYYSFMAAGAGLLAVALVCSLMLLRSEYRTKRLK